MDKCREQLINLVDIVEKQIKFIKDITGFSDFNLSPQIQAVEEAKKVLEQECEEAE